MKVFDAVILSLLGLASEAKVPVYGQANEKDNEDVSSSQKETDDPLLTQLVSEVHPLWLRERCHEAFYVDVETKQPKYNLHEEVDGLTIAKVAKNNDANSYSVTFSDDQTCVYNAAMLQAELSGETYLLQAPEWSFPPMYIWNASLIAPPVFEHDEIIDQSYQTRKFLSTLITTGLAVVANVPTEPGECVRFGSKFSFLRVTEWGPEFNVQTKPDTAAGGVARKDLAYSSHAIGMHIDSPYRIDTPPAYQLLHAMEHCSKEDPECQVHNQFVDGFAVSHAICEMDRAMFDVLTKVSLRWENNGGDNTSMLFRYAPMIELDDQKSPRTDAGCPTVKAINFSAKSGGYAPSMSNEEADLFYRAKRQFSDMLHSPDFTVKVQLWPGALVIFDNRRVLHSRSNIAVEDGPRWLQGCYLSRDGIHYLYEKLRRSIVKTETPFRSLRTATKADFDRMGVEYDIAVARKTMKNLVGMLEKQKDVYLGQPVSLYEHNVQTASRALRAGEEDEVITFSLFHDVFETLAVKNHGELAASMLAPWISPGAQWLLAHHEIGQGYYYFEHYGIDKNKRDMFKEHAAFEWMVDWCEQYDQTSFDPDYPSLPLSELLPAVERILAKPQYWWNPEHPKAGAVWIGEASSMALDGEKIEKNIIHTDCRNTWTCY